MAAVASKFEELKTLINNIKNGNSKANDTNAIAFTHDRARFLSSPILDVRAEVKGATDSSAKSAGEGGTAIVPLLALSLARGESSASVREAELWVAGQTLTVGKTFITADDKIYQVTTAGTVGTTAPTTTSSATATGGTAVVTDFTNATQVAAYLSERFTAAAGAEQVFVINNTASGANQTFVYTFVENGTATSIVDIELALVGIINNNGVALVDANVVYS
jgi:hypothetical protein